MVATPTRTNGTGPLNVIDKPDPWKATALPDSPLFGTDGIRGRVGDILNPTLAMQIGYWAGIILQEQTGRPGPLILGQDSRNSSMGLAAALSAGLTAAGVDVWNLGLCPTPCVAHLANLTANAIGGVMISASHNPPEDNGIKFFSPNGTKLSPNLQQKIETGLRGHLPTPPQTHWGQNYYRPGLVSDYTSLLLQPFPSHGLQGMRIVLDLAWGAAVGVAPATFQALGAEVIALHNEPDGNRINVDCGSTHLHILQQAVLEHQAHLGFAFDGDADRVLAVDNQGRPVDGDYILYLWGQKLRAQGELPKDLIVSTVMANLGFERAWQKLGGTLLRTAVGDQYVQAEMLTSGAMLGGEQSGHILCLHHGMTGDGLLTALHIAALVQESNISLAQLVNNSFQTYPQLLKNIRVEDRQRRLGWQNCPQIQTAINSAEQAMGERGRVLVRASGTEPLIRVMVEAETADLAHYWTDYLVSVVQQSLG